MERSPYATDAAVHLIEGRAGTGKTARLVQEAALLLRHGAAAHAMVLVAATPAAADALAARLREVCGADGELPLVTTMASLQVALLSTPGAVSRTGREGRTLLSFEEAMLFEDMKTSGVAPKRLREMMRFLVRSAVDLEPMEGDWFYGDEEERVFSLLRRQLDYRRAHLAAALPRAAFDYLADGSGAVEGARFDHVLVDDYQALSRASQCLAGRLARTTLTVAGDGLATAGGVEDFPCPEGLAALAAANPTCAVETLTVSQTSRAVAEGIGLLVADEALGGAGALGPAPASERVRTGVCEAVAFDRLEDELEGVADLVRRHLDDGLAPESIAVIAPRRRWAALVRRALEARGIATATAERASVNGDFRDRDRCPLSRAVTLLRLHANPRDPLALRSWCGFADHLANSALASAWSAANAVPGLEGSLPDLGKAESTLRSREAARARDALGEAARLVRSLGEKRGAALFAAACEAVSPEGAAIADDALLAAVAQAGADADAAALCRAIEEACRLPHFAGYGVRLGLPEDFIGTSAAVVVMTGLVNGLTLPRRYFDPAQMERDKRPALLAAEAARTYIGASRARDELFLTYFAEAPLAAAEALQLKLYRVRLRHGERVCEIRPSETIRAITGVSHHD